MDTKRGFIKAAMILGVLAISIIISPKALASTCTDTDGGQNYYTKGYVNLAGYGWDYCSNATTLLEQDCGTDASGNILDYGRTSTYTCPNGCIDGACASPSIRITSPNGGESWEIGAVKRVSWSATGVNFVRIYVYDESIASSGSTNYIYEYAIPASIGYFDWTIKKAQLPGFSLSFPRNYKIRVDGVNEVTVGASVVVQDHSDNNFSIADTATPSIRIVSPNGGEQWEAGKAYNITWVSTGYIAVRVNITCEGYGSGAILNVPSGSTGGSYSYTIPASWAAQSQCKAQVSENVSMLLNGVTGVNYDMSDNYFSIAARIMPACEKNNYAAKCNGATATVNPNYSPYTDHRSADLAIDGDLTSEWMGSWDTNEPTVYIVKLPARVAVNSIKIYFDSSKDLPYRASDPTVPDEGIFLPKELQIEFNEAGSWVRKNTDTNIKTKGWRTYSITGDTDQVKFIIPDTWAWNKYAIINEIGVYGTSLGLATTSCLPDNTLIKLPNDSKVYVIINCQKKWIQTSDEFIRNNYKWENVQQDFAGTINQLPDYSNSDLSKTIPDGSIIQATGDADVYIVKYVGSKAYKRLILSPSVFKSYGHLKWGNIIKVDKSTLNGFITSNLVRSANSGKMYSLSPSGDTGVRRLIKDAVILQNLGLDSSSAYEINSTDENSYIPGQDL